MKWFYKLERKFGRYAITNLMYYVIVMYVIGFIIDLVNPVIAPEISIYHTYLALDAAAILRGEVWRIVTFLLQPPDAGIIFMVFALFLYYSIGKTLEFVWGAFRFNFYFFMGVIFHIIAAMVTYLITGVSFTMGTMYLNLSLFFAYAAVFPNQQLYIFFFIPIKMKWLALIDGILFGMTILRAFLPQYGGNPIYGIYYKGLALQAFVSILNFLVFFLLTRNLQKVSPKEIYRKQKYRKEMHQAKMQSHPHQGAMHKCTVCGRTELDDPNLEFRYCSKCNGNYEYCQDHLFTHEHIQ